MAYKLRLTATLCRDKAECDHFPLQIVQPFSRVIIAKAVICQPAVDMTALFRSRLVKFFHAIPENIDLRLDSGFQSRLHRCLRLRF